MIELFRKDLFFNYVLLLPYCLALRLKTFITPQAYLVEDTNGWLNHVVYSFLDSSALLQSILAAILIFVQAIMINYISNKNNIAHYRSSFPGLLYILLVSYAESFLILTPLLIGSTFFIIALINLFDTYKRPKCTVQIFNVGFLIALAAMFYLPFALYFIASFVGLIIMRSFKFKERAQYFTGFCVAIYLIFIGSYFRDFHASFFSEYFRSNIDYFNLFSGLTGLNLNILILNFALIFIAIVCYNIYTIKKSIQSQKKIDILYWVLFMSIPTLFFWQGVGLNHFVILALPLSIFYSMNLLKISNSLLVEMMHLLILATIFAGHFNFWIF